MNLVNQIKEIFEQEPSNLGKIREFLNSREFTKEELAELAIAFTDNCFCEYHDALEPEVESVTIENSEDEIVEETSEEEPTAEEISSENEEEVSEDE